MYLDELLKLEEELVFEGFNSEDALALGLTFVKLAKEAGKGGIGIKIEKNGHVLFTHLMDGTMPENAYWYDRKKNVVDRYFHSSQYVSEMFKADGTTFEESGLLDLEHYQAVGGSFPMIIRNAGVVGSITVCGLSGAEDHQLCVQGIREFLEKKREGKCEK